MSKFVHMELNTSDPEAAKKFYAAVFGWTYEDVPMPDGVYSMVNTPDGPLGGIQKSPMEGVPSHWLGYISVESIDRTIDAVEDAGGSVIVPRTEIPGMGIFSIFTDPTGAVFAAWESSRPMTAGDDGDASQSAAAEPAAEPAQAKKAAKKKAAKKAAPAKKAAKKKAAAAPAEPAAPAEAEAAPAPAPSKKASKKKAGKKAAAAKKAAPVAAPSKKASKKKAAKKAAPAAAPSKKASKKKAAKKAAPAAAPSKKASKKASKKPAKKK